MTAIFSLATFATALFSVLAFRSAQTAQARREQRARHDADRRQQAEHAEQEARQRDRTYPHDLVFHQSTRMTHELTPANAALPVAQRESSEAKARHAAMPGPEHSGLQLLLRYALLAVLVLVVALGFALAMETFVALNNGQLGVLPIAKGLVAGGLELLVAFAVTRLLHDRHPNELRWQVELALCGAVLVLLCGYLATYSPQRSAQQYGQTVATDQAVLTRAEDSRPRQALAVTAARAKLSSDQGRMHRAEDSDAVMAVAIPIVELLTAELAFEGLLDLLAVRRRRKAEEHVRATQATIDAIEGEIALTQNRYGLETLELLRDRGINNLQDYLGGQAHQTPAPQPSQRGPVPGAEAPMPAPPPARPANPAAVPAEPRTPPADGAGGINLDGFAPPNQQPGIGPEWNAAAT